MAEYKRIYADYNFDYFMDSMLRRIPDEYDKRQGSPIWDALAPAAIELSNEYVQLDYIVKNMFGDTADRKFLELHAKDRNLYPNPATYATIKGEFNIELRQGTRFNLEDMNYYVIEFLEKKNDLYYYELKCEMAGRMGNIPYGDLSPIQTVEGLKYAKNMGLISPAEDIEGTEDFRQRYIDSFHDTRYGGNITDYKDFVGSIDGVGSVKVYPVWDGGGTVKIIFLDSEYKSPVKELIEKVQEVIDPIPYQQQGKGKAPIGHFVTVEGAESFIVNVNTHITMIEGYTFEDVKVKVEEVINKYFLEVNKEWHKEERSILRTAKLESYIVDINGVLDIENTKFNNKEGNLILKDNQVLVLGSVENE